jgi:hypothetical protein
MDLLEFQVDFMSFIQDHSENDETNNSKNYELKLNNSIIYEILNNLFQPRYKTAISILYIEFPEIHKTKIIKPILEYSLDYTRDEINKYKGNDLKSYLELCKSVLDYIDKLCEFYFIVKTQTLYNIYIGEIEKTLFNNEFIKPFILNADYETLYEFTNLTTNSYSLMECIFSNIVINIDSILKMLKYDNLLTIFNKAIIKNVNQTENLKLIFKKLVIEKDIDYYKLLDYITETDIFINNYKTFLSKLPRTVYDYDKYLIGRCIELNFIDANHCNQIINDIENTTDHFYDNHVSFMICNSGLWPYKDISQQPICKTFENSFFKQLQENIYSEANKNLTWMYNKMSAEINFNNYILTVPASYVDTLMEFNDSDYIDYSENKHKFLVKYKILKLNKNKTKVSPIKIDKNIDLTKIITINKNKKLNKINGNNNEIVDIDYYIDSILIKTIKKNNILSTLELKSFINRISITENKLLERLNKLCDKDYIEKINDSEWKYLP